MKALKFFIIMLLVSNITMAQNFGIGTTTPSSKLNVNGSFEAVYKLVSTTPYNVDANDFFLSYGGAFDGTFNLPAAASGALSYGGRTYHFKNTGSAMLTIAANGSELIDNTSDVPSIVLQAGWSCKIISKGTTSGSTWEVSLLSRTPVSFTQSQVQGVSIYQLGTTTTPGTDIGYLDIVTLNVTVPVTGNYLITAKAFFAVAYPPKDRAYASGAQGSFKLDVDGTDYDETYLHTIGGKVSSTPSPDGTYISGLASNGTIAKVLNLTAGAHVLKLQARTWAVWNVFGLMADGSYQDMANWGIPSASYLGSGGITNAGKCKIEITYIN